MKKKKIHIIIGRTLLVFLVSGAVVLLFGAMRAKEDKVCSSLNIQIGQDGQKGFVNKKDITELIKGTVHTPPVGSSIKQFDLRKIESLMEKNEWIKNAQMYFDNNAVLHVQIEQRFPIARIMDVAGASYYIDSVGFKLPLSATDIANVPVFTNVPLKTTTKANASLVMSTITSMSKCIIADSFWLAQAAQIDVLPTGKFQMYPAFGNHVIEMGDGSNPADKLSRLKLFYKNISVKKGFDAYPVLSVAFDRQIVAVMGDSAAPNVDTKKTALAFDQMVEANRTSANKEEQPEEDKKPVKAPEKIVTARAPVKAKPPDTKKAPEEKNKGNPAKKVPSKNNKTNIQSPKAQMPKGKH